MFCWLLLLLLLLLTAAGFHVAVLEMCKLHTKSLSVKDNSGLTLWGWQGNSRIHTNTHRHALLSSLFCETSSPFTVRLAPSWQSMGLSVKAHEVFEFFFKCCSNRRKKTSQDFFCVRECAKNTEANTVRGLSSVIMAITQVLHKQPCCLYW